MAVNRVILIGNVGKDPVVKHFDKGTVARFSLATSETYKNKNGEKVTNTEWHNIVVWRAAEFVEKYVKKGSQLYIEGRIRTNSWEDKEGNKRATTEIVADNLQLMGRQQLNTGIEQSDIASGEIEQEEPTGKNSKNTDSGEAEKPENVTNGETDNLPF